MSPSRCRERRGRRSNTAWKPSPSSRLWQTSSTAWSESTPGFHLGSPAVDALSLVKGIDVPSAFLLAVEFGDFARFGSGRAVSCRAGLAPSSSDSTDKHANGRITKTGNPCVRSALIEGLSNMHVRKADAKKLRKGQEVSGPVRRLCRQCDARMAERYERMSKEGKQPNAIKVALANEMARWTWVIGLAVAGERAVQPRPT